jgi:hypothetical protein
MVIPLKMADICVKKADFELNLIGSYAIRAWKGSCWCSFARDQWQGMLIQYPYGIKAASRNKVLSIIPPC